MMRENISEVDNINDFADKINVDIINLSHVVPRNELKTEDSAYDLPYSIGKMNRFDVNAVFVKELDSCPFVKEKFCFVRYDGEVIPCMQLLHNSYTYLFTEKRKIYSHSFGNIMQKRLYEIYKSKEYFDFRKRVNDFGFPCCTVCLGCEDRKENPKDCMYNDSPTCGACLWAQGIIRCP